MKNFESYKKKRISEIELYASTLQALNNNTSQGADNKSVSQKSKSVHFGEQSVLSDGN